jgi:hypothetical protein
MPPSLETHQIIDSALDALRRNGFENLIAASELDEIVIALMGVEPRLSEAGPRDVRLAVSGWIAKNQVRRPVVLRYAPSFTDCARLYGELRRDVEGLQCRNASQREYQAK